MLINIRFASAANATTWDSVWWHVSVASVFPVEVAVSTADKNFVVVDALLVVVATNVGTMMAWHQFSWYQVAIMVGTGYIHNLVVSTCRTGNGMKNVITQPLTSFSLTLTALAVINSVGWNLTSMSVHPFRALAVSTMSMIVTATEHFLCYEMFVVNLIIKLAECCFLFLLRPYFKQPITHSLFISVVPYQRPHPPRLFHFTPRCNVIIMRFH